MSPPCSATLNPPRSKAPAQVKSYVSAPSLGCRISTNMAKPELFFQLTQPSPELLLSAEMATILPAVGGKPPQPVIDSSLVSASDTHPSCPVFNFQGHFFLGNTAMPQPLFTLCILSRLPV